MYGIGQGAKAVATARQAVATARPRAQTSSSCLFGTQTCGETVGAALRRSARIPVGIRSQTFS